MTSRSAPLIALILLVVPCIGSPPLQNARRAQSCEQSSFSAEEDFTHPVSLNEWAKQTIANEQSIADLLKNEKLSVESMPEDWFTASDVHLSGNPREVDLVVMGDHIARGPNSSAFWVLRQSSGGYKLVFRTDAHDLMLLKTKTNELRDIRTAFSSLLYNSTAEFRFTGNVYQVAKRTLQPNGYKAHRDMSQYEFRKTLVQLTGQDPTPILAEARAWLWQHWQAHKRSYLRVSTHDDDGERQDCSYFFDDESEVGQWQVTIEAHRVVSHKDSPSGPPYLVAEDEILIASQVQRTEPKVDDSHMPRILHDVEELPATAYRLRFIDYRNISLDTL